MFTPQQIQEQTFARAVFGGYDMAQVDAFLEPLTDDYIELYKENAVLKSKMKFLVEKLEELRGAEKAGAAATAETQAECDRMLAETKKKCDEMLENAKKQASESEELSEEEQQRLTYAKQTALNFIEVIEGDVKAHLELLESLKSRDLSIEKEEKKPVREKPYDWQAHEPKTPVHDAKTEAIADEISENVGRIVGVSEEDEIQPAQTAPHHVESPTIKFPDLQFGKNYNPTAENNE